MRNVCKIATMLIIMGLGFTSCSSDNLTEDQNLYENASEGDDGKIKDHPVG